MQEKDPYVRENFFKKLKLKKTALEEELEDKDKPGFQLEDWAGRYRMYILRQENQYSKKQHWYTISIFNGPEPKDILVQTKNKDFKIAVRTYYSALEELRIFCKKLF